MTSVLLILLLVDNIDAVRRAVQLEKRRAARLAREARQEGVNIAREHRDCTDPLSPPLMNAWPVRGRRSSSRRPRKDLIESRHDVYEKTLRPRISSDALAQSRVLTAPLKSRMKQNRPEARLYGRVEWAERQAALRARMLKIWEQHGLDISLAPEDLAQRIEDLDVNDFGRQSMCWHCSQIVKSSADEDYHRRYLLAKKRIWDRRRHEESRQRCRESHLESQKKYRRKLRVEKDLEYVEELKSMGLDFDWPLARLLETAKGLDVPHLSSKACTWLIKRHVKRPRNDKVVNEDEKMSQVQADH